VYDREKECESGRRGQDKKGRERKDRYIKRKKNQCCLFVCVCVCVCSCGRESEGEFERERDEGRGRLEQDKKEIE
jgi:hypothetical protein